MDEQAVRASAQSMADALVAGDVDSAIAYLSDELKRNLGEVVAMLPLPATEAEIVSVEQTGGGAATIVVLRLVGETAEDELQTRWKDRDEGPRVVEVSHLSRREREGTLPEEGEGPDGEGAESTPTAAS